MWAIVNSNHWVTISKKLMPTNTFAANQIPSIIPYLVKPNANLVSPTMIKLQSHHVKLLPHLQP
jgi:hypothetical protein